MPLKPSDYGILAGILVIGIVLVVYFSQSLVAPFFSAMLGSLGVLLYLFSRADESFMRAMCSVIFFAAIGVPIWLYASDVKNTIVSAILSCFVAYFAYRAYSVRTADKKVKI